MKPCIFSHYRPPQVLARGLWRGEKKKKKKQINYQGDPKDTSALQGNGEKKRNAHIPVSHLISPIPSKLLKIINLRREGGGPVSGGMSCFLSSDLNSRVPDRNHTDHLFISPGLKVSP